MRIVRTLIGLSLLASASLAGAATPVPERQIPSEVRSELRLLESRFVLALAEDCDTKRCFSKGCFYGDHAVSDRPKSNSLPGLAQEAGPGSVAAQNYLIAATCAFSYEDGIDAADVRSLSRRLRSKLSTGWTVVKIEQQRLQALPDYLQHPPVPTVDSPEEPVDSEPVVVPDTLLSPSRALNELWATLLPHLYWMIGLTLFTLAVFTLIWAWRRLGQESIEEKLLLAELSQPEPIAQPSEEEEATVVPEEPEEDAFVVGQRQLWTDRLGAVTPEQPDLALDTLFYEMLCDGDWPFLAKLMVLFPDEAATLLPTGGSVASAKLELSDYLKQMDLAELPSDEAFFRRLNRWSLSAAVGSQSDAQIVHSLRHDFGAFGLATLIGSLSPRAGALLFALAPASAQREMVRLFKPSQVASMSQMLLRSNRMNRAESTYLFDLLSAARVDQTLPVDSLGELTDRGTEVNALGALSVLLEAADPSERSALFEGVISRFSGRLPAWHRGLFWSEMLNALSDEARADLLLEVDIQPLAAWLSLLDESVSDAVLEGVAQSLRKSIVAVSVFSSPEVQFDLAEQARVQLARGFQRQISREKLSFEGILCPL